MSGQPSPSTETDTPLIDVTTVAQEKLGEALAQDPDLPGALRLYIQGFG